MNITDDQKPKLALGLKYIADSAEAIRRSPAGRALKRLSHHRARRSLRTAILREIREEVAP